MITGKTIAITRSKDDSQEFITLAQRDGAIPISLPTIQLVSKGQKIVDEFLESVSQYDPDYSVFMSSKAVRLLFDTAIASATTTTTTTTTPPQNSKLDTLKLAIANTIVVAVGPKTKEALQSYGIHVSFTPNQVYSSVGIGELFTTFNAVGKKVLIPRSGASTPFLKQLLNKIGLDVQEIHLYDVCAFDERPTSINTTTTNVTTTTTTQWNQFRELFSQNNIDGLIFTSVSSVKGFFEIMEKDYSRNQLVDRLQKMCIVSIGPFTAEQLKNFDTKNVISEVHTVLGAYNTIKSTLFTPPN